MRVYICDDEKLILKELEKEIKCHVPEAAILCFDTGSKLLEKIEISACDILFLDIDMPEISGMDIAKALSGLYKPPLLVFVTSHDELVYESLQDHPFGFIRKNYIKQEIEKVLNDCSEQLKSSKRRFYFRTAGKDAALFLTEILYFEADGNYLKIYTNKESYRFRSTVTAVENSLAHYGFVRVHKGFLVNQSAVRLIGREEIELTDGTRISLGKSFAGRARQQLLEYLR